MTRLNVQLLMTGNELMSGDIVDSNSAMLAEQLKDIGIEIKRKVTVSDSLEQLVIEITQISAQADLLIINGGLGPTIDDLTAKALALAANLPLQQHPQALAHLKNWSRARQIELNEPNLKQALLPLNCNIIANDIGSAVGFHLKINDCDIYCTPGVPLELNRMLENTLLPEIEQKFPLTDPVVISRYHTFGIGESSLQKMIDEELPNWPNDIELGFRAAHPLVEVKLTTRSKQALHEKQQWLNKLITLFGDHIINHNQGQPASLASNVIALLIENNLKITTAESCTGGLIASLLTQVPGSSQGFEAGFVTYSNVMKHKLIGVSEATLETHGAVSQATVIEMASGAINQADADLAIAVSGIAGPGGGSKEKPVGTVWIAWGNKNKLNSQGLCIPGKREHFQQQVAAIALDLVRRFILNSKQEPYYIKMRKIN